MKYHLMGFQFSDFCKHSALNLIKVGMIHWILHVKTHTAIVIYIPFGVIYLPQVFIVSFAYVRATPLLPTWATIIA